MRSLFLIFNNIKRRQGQVLVSVAIATITIFIFTLVFGILLVMQDGLKLSKEKLGADLILVPGYAPIENRELLFTASPENVYMPYTVLDDVAKIKGVANFTPQFFAQTLALSCCNPGEEVRIIGFDPDTDFILEPYLKFKTQKIKPHEIILGSNFDKDMIGKPFLILGMEFYPINQLNPSGSGMDNTIFMTLDAVQELSRNSVFKESLWKKRNPSDYISAILVKLEDGVDPADIQNDVEEQVKGAKVVLTGETIAQLQAQIKIIMQLLIIFWLGVLLVSFLSLFGRFNAIADSRKKEIGLLRALGVKKTSLFVQIIGECSAMALLGGIFGTLTTSLCMPAVVNILKKSFSITPSVWNFKTSLFSIAIGCLLSLGIGIVSALYPAIKSVNLDPQEAITQGNL